MRLHLPLMAISCLLPLAACMREPCDPREEPYVHLYFSYDSTGSRYRQAYLLNSLRPASRFDLDKTDSLPLSLVADSAVYVLESPTRIDTLGVSYIRKIAFQAKECGFTATLENLRVLKRATTFSDVTVETRPRSSGGLFKKSNQTTYRLFIHL